MPTKYIAAAFAIALLFNSNVRQLIASSLSSLWSRFSNPSKPIVDFPLLEPTSSKAKAVNNCVSRFLHSPSNNAEHIFRCLDPSKDVDSYDTVQKIKHAYRAGAQFLHPDHGGSNENMHALKKATESLMDRISWWQ